jgi:hypothetical protein
VLDYYLLLETVVVKRKVKSFKEGFCKYLWGRVLNNMQNIPSTDKACYLPPGIIGETHNRNMLPV